MFNTLFNNLTTGLAARSAGKATSTALQSSAAGLGGALSSFLSGQPVDATRPKAYLAWILFDEQFKIVSSNARLVGAPGAALPLAVNNLPVNKSGYLYVYTSNESTNVDVPACRQAGSLTIFR